MQISFEEYIDKTPNGLFPREGWKEGHTGGGFTLNADPGSELSSPFSVTKKICIEYLGDTYLNKYC